MLRPTLFCINKTRFKNFHRLPRRHSSTFKEVLFSAGLGNRTQNFRTVVGNPVLEVPTHVRSADRPTGWN